jgi:hypothetical protein
MERAPCQSMDGHAGDAEIFEEVGWPKVGIIACVALSRKLARCPTVSLANGNENAQDLSVLVVSCYVRRD